MIIFLQIVFWLSIFLILHSYIFFPILLQFFSKKRNFDEYKLNDNLPKISILMSIYNEELVIAQKIDSILKSEYPENNIEIIIGSDCSDDSSNQIVAEYSDKYSFIKFFPFTTRQGKPNVINKIAQKAGGDILILTDANVMFDKKTIFELVRFFKDKKIGLVDSQMINNGLVKNGISIQESSYISREVKIKNNESNIWGTMMGPFGGCYAIRKELYKPVPKNFLVDDFYINMMILEQGYKSINNTKAFVFEDVSNNLKDEFRRKIRIATGNFQNLKTFKHFLLAFISKGKKFADKINYSLFGLSFSFISHKILRWLSPFFIVFIAFSGLFLLDLKIYFYLYICFILSFSLPIIDFFLKKINIHINLLRFASHFIFMNIALMVGFFRFLKGVKSGIWKPTKRNQVND